MKLNSQMRVMKRYLKARYRLADLLRAQRNDRMTSNLKKWIENGSPDKGDLEEDSYRILRQYFMQKEGRLYLNKDGIVACKIRDEDKDLYKYNAIVLPQLYQTELLFMSHDQMGHQGIDKVYQRILKRFEWPGMTKACEKWVTACLSCQQVKDPRKLRFPLQSIESSEFNEVVQIDDQKICMTDSGYNQVLVMIDHFTKYVEAVPCITASAEETIAVSKRSTSLLPQKEVVRTDLQPFKQETQPLAKIWCVKMEEDTHQPNELNIQMRVMKRYLKARYRISDLLRAQRNDRMTSNLKKWIENGSPDKGDLEEDSYRILRQNFMQKEGRLYLNKDGIVACKRRDEDKVLYKYNEIVLPQLYQTELLFMSHDQMGHQGIDKVYQRILKRFEWPGMKKACEKWVTACLSCQQVKDPRKLRFPLQSIESSELNEVVHLDHQKMCMTDSGYNQVLVKIDHFTKYAEAVPCITASAEETCDHLINTWIARHGCPMTFQSINGTAFVGERTKELMRRSQVAQAHSTTYHPQTNGLVERQNKTLVSMLRVYCSRCMTDWDRYLPQVMGAYNSTQLSTTGVSPHMMLTGHKKSLPLTCFYPEYEGKNTSPQVYVRDVIRRQQELNDLCRRNTQQAQARQRKKFDKKAAGAKAYSVGDYVWVFQNVIPPKGTKKLLKKWRGPFMITEVHQEGGFYRLSTG